MKIGILTFHWGTNYGAILQAFCLQEFLIELGHEVDIINYKPRQFDFSWLKYIKHPRLIKFIKRDLTNRYKESLLKQFRENWLHTTHRYYTVSDFGKDIEQYDVLISGSDQVLNPYFTLCGEKGKPSPAYWLGIGRKDAIRLGYAVSFGCDEYPETAMPLAKHWVKVFDAIGVREQTGLQILEHLSYDGPKVILPDPTLLLGKTIFDYLKLEKREKREDYTCVYMLRHEMQMEGNVRYIDEKHHPLNMEEWMQTIINAERLITNSYHGMIMAMLAHVPFAVLLETGSGSGMNDRFYSLLGRLGLGNRMVLTLEEAVGVFENDVDYDQIDIAVSNFKQVGVDFLKEYLN